MIRKSADWCEHGGLAHSDGASTIDNPTAYLPLSRRVAILAFCMLTLTLYFTTILVVSAILPQIQGALSATPDGCRGR